MIRDRDWSKDDQITDDEKGVEPSSQNAKRDDETERRRNRKEGVDWVRKNEKKKSKALAQRDSA